MSKLEQQFQEIKSQLPFQRYTPSRFVHVNSNHVTVEFKRLSRVAALYGSVDIMYADIESVIVGPAEGISPLAPRIGYSNPMSGARAGRFRTKGLHILAGYDTPDDDCLHLLLRTGNPSSFDQIIMQIKNPQEIAGAIEAKRNES
ncbi:hypothetical protein EON76_02710 [bacterium]|nr:MAG: hypothetical protein EON76_02710 [bacterium]